MQTNSIMFPLSIHLIELVYDITNQYYKKQSFFFVQSLLRCTQMHRLSYSIGFPSVIFQYFAKAISEAVAH